jgi:phosphatidylserine/phosphatidylglycerophosphate/cardiolipin synthase-like enzyme
MPEERSRRDGQEAGLGPALQLRVQPPRHARPLPGVRGEIGEYNSGMTRCAILAAIVALTSVLTLNAREPREADQAKPAAATDSGVSVWFSPDGGCTAAIVAKIRSARKTIEVQAYSFTSTDIAHALADAKARGVKVRVILDKSNEERKYGASAFIVANGVSVWIDAKHEITHNKVMILDGATVITGSFNFIHQAEVENAENLLVIEGKPKLAAAYEKNFETHLAHSKPYSK